MTRLVFDRADLKTTRKLTALMRREVVGLPDMRVTTRLGQAHITWTDGPTEWATFRLWGPLVDTPWLPTTFTRLLTPATFGAVVLTLDGSHITQDQLVQTAQRHLEDRDLTADPLPDDLRAAGGVLAAMAAVPSNALIGPYRRRWEHQMCGTLRAIGRAAVEGVRTPALT